MKILVTTQTEAGVGIHNALLALGHESYLWQEAQKPAFDAFNELKPSILVADKRLVSRALQKCIDKFQPRTIITDTVDPLADTVIYKPGEYDPFLATKFAAVGQQDESILRKLCYPVGRYDLRVYGSYRYREMVQYVGQHDLSTFNRLCTSANYVLNFGANAQLTWNALAAGAHVIQGANVPNTREYAGFQVEIVDTFKDLVQLHDSDRPSRLNEFDRIDSLYSYKHFVKGFLNA